jgi:solute carrier family 25 (mitochondrial S-adenosylmethionine transporter), member 26
MASNGEEASTPFHLALISGGVAGTAVDVSLYPLDTLKTRLQSQQGFWKAGGFSGVYRGLGAAAIVPYLLPLSL